MTVPNNKILTLGAICLSLVAGIGAYKIGEARKIALQNELQTKGAVYVDIQTTNEEAKLLQDAFEKISLDSTLGSSTDGNPFAPSETDTLTDTLAKNLFLSYAQQQGTGVSEDDETTAQKILGQINTTNLPKNPFNISNVTMYVPKNADEVRAYGNATGEVIKSNYIEITNLRNKEDLGEIARIHKKIGEELIKIPAPAAISQGHLTVANSFAMLGQSFSVINSQEKKDPLQALLAIRTARDAAESLEKSYQQINKYFLDNAILYSENEAGLIWSRLLSS